MGRAWSRRTRCNKGGFTIGSFNTIAKAKAELAEFFGYEPDYEAYEGRGLCLRGIIENEDAYADPMVNT